jgi:hypothetical protein
VVIIKSGVDKRGVKVNLSKQIVKVGTEGWMKEWSLARPVKSPSFLHSSLFDKYILACFPTKIA